MSQTAGTEQAITQRQADVLGRQFNSALTNTNAYGSDHPVTGRTYATFLTSLNQVLEAMDPITLMFDRGSLFIEDYPLDGKFNSTRISMIFRSLGLQSITFARGVDEDALERLMMILASHEEYEDIDAVRSELQSAGIETIRVNHVVMRKFSEDEAVISREGLEDLTEMAEQSVARTGPSSKPRVGSALTGDLMSRIENVFTMRNLVKRPDEMAEQLLTTSWKQGSDQSRLVDQIRSLRHEIDDGDGGDGSDVSLPEVMEALYKIRQELSDTLAGQNEIARFMAENGGEVLDEVDQLTYQTVLSIVREEYRNGTTSVKRLAQIMRRVLPDSRDVKRFLPMLKEGLLAEGMPLDDYIGFVNELSSELKSEDLVRVLEEGSESVGLSVDELVREIRRDPAQAARLLVLAAELRQGGQADEDRLSAILTDYIERASGELVSGDAGTTCQPNELRKAIRGAQHELVQQVCSHGVSPSLGARIESGLAERVDESVERVRARRLSSLLRESAGLDEPELVEALEHFVERESALETLSDTIRTELEGLGYSEVVVKRIYEQTERRLRGRSRLELLPDGMLEPNVLNYLLEREIASSRRHGTYFSCILLMIARIRDAADGSGDRGWRPAQPEEVEVIIPQVFRALPPHVRDVDLLGSLGTKDRNIPLILLTMTRDEGAAIVLNRMLPALDATRYDLDGRPVRIETIGVAESFDADRTPDRKSYLKSLQTRLASALVNHLHRKSPEKKEPAGDGE